MLFSIIYPGASGGCSCCGVSVQAVSENNIYMARTNENSLKIAQFIKGFVEREHTLDFDVSAVCAIIEHSSRLAERQDKLSTRFNYLSEILGEAFTWARLENASIITAEHIQKTIATQQQNADVEDLLRSFQFEGLGLQQQIEDVMQQITDTGAAAVDAVADSVTLSIAHAAVFVAAFLVLVLALWLAMLPLKLMTKLPGLHALNTVGGAALGLVWGVLLVFLVVWALRRFGWLITPELVEHSWLLRFFANNSPLDLLTLF